jgi:uncharacterized protein YkwD
MGIIGFIARSVFWTIVVVAISSVLIAALGSGAGLLEGEVLSSGADNEITEQKVEEEIISQVNEIRAENGATAVERDRDLQQQAKFHSSEMAEHEELAHDIGVSTTEKRLNDAACSTGGENVALNYKNENVETENGAIGTYDSESLAEAIVTNWENSPPHFDGMIDPKWSDTGVGVVITEDGKVYATQKFCV